LQNDTGDSVESKNTNVKKQAVEEDQPRLQREEADLTQRHLGLLTVFS
jgi:hypothetical protein